MNVITLSPPTVPLNGKVVLPTSKSISNRALILNQIIGNRLTLHNLSDADDTQLMLEALTKTQGSVHLKNAGTCMRFLAAYFAATPGSDITLLCDERMEKRPIHELVEVLRNMGADIVYLNRDGFPPLHIKGQQLLGGDISISASASSQFVTALLLIAPLCKHDVILTISGTITSLPYIDMTIALMQQFGIDIIRNQHTIKIASAVSQKTIEPAAYWIEPDWSAAAFWYQIVALSHDASIVLPHLSLKSLQGDCVIAQYMNWFGVETTETSEGILLRKKMAPTTVTVPAEIDLTHTPDLTPSLAVMAAATHTPITLTGLQNLVIKESNRIQAIQNELTQLGFNITSTNNSLTIYPTHTQQPISPVSTYNDHRIAMAFAPLALLFDQLRIQHPEVVEKSYPGFWNDLKSVGFRINSQ